MDLFHSTMFKIKIETQSFRDRVNSLIPTQLGPIGEASICT